MRVVRLTSATVAAILTLVLSAGAAPAAAPVSSGHSGWFWGSPTPQGRDLERTTFDGATGYAVGDFGTVLRSDDGGRTWTGLNSGTQDDLTTVQELDPSTAVVAGDCTVAETTDAGADFHRLSELAGPSCGGGVVAVAFTSASHGYVALADGEILFTADAGRTVTARASVPDSSGGLTDVSFTDDDDGLAVSNNGVIERTTDGARSWNRATSTEESLRSVSFATPEVVYAVGDFGTALRSQDGGATWSPLPSMGDVFDLTHVSCRDAVTCVISALYTTGNGGNLLTTADGGQTVTDVTPSGEWARDATFAAGRDLVAVGANGEIVVSADGGATFPRPVSAELLAPVSRVASTPLRVGGTDGDAYLSAIRGRIGVTTDGGQSWSSVRVPGGADVVDTAFPTTAIGYAIAGNGILRATRNGGASWRVLDATVGRSSQLAAVGRRVVVIAGPRGLQRSSDGGASFATVTGTVIRQPRRAPVRIARLELSHVQSSGARVVAWGPQAAVESTDGGVHWGAVRLPRRTVVEYLSFVSARTGWISDAAGELLRTDDRGATWRDVRSLGISASAGVDFANARDGYVVTPVGSDRTVLPFDLLVTTDGGRSWQPQVIDGSGRRSRDPLAIATVAAAGRHAYLLSPEEEPVAYNPGPDPDPPADPALFATSNDGRSAERSSMSLVVRTARGSWRSTRRYGLSVRGQLRPAPGPAGSRAMVSERRPGATWRSKLVRIGADGSFQTVLRDLTGRTDVVAYALGDGRVDGAGAFREIRPPRAAQRSTK